MSHKAKLVVLMLLAVLAANGLAFELPLAKASAPPSHCHGNGGKDLPSGDSKFQCCLIRHDVPLPQLFVCDQPAISNSIIADPETPAYMISSNIEPTSFKDPPLPIPLRI